jgi:hypothetical protein
MNFKSTDNLEYLKIIKSTYYISRCHSQEEEEEEAEKEKP